MGMSWQIRSNHWEASAIALTKHAPFMTLGITGTAAQGACKFLIKLSGMQVLCRSRMLCMYPRETFEYGRVMHARLRLPMSEP